MLITLGLYVADVEKAMLDLVTDDNMLSAFQLW